MVTILIINESVNYFYVYSSMTQQYNHYDEHEEIGRLNVSGVGDLKVTGNVLKK